MRTAVEWPDPEIAARELADALLEDVEPDVTVRIGVPSDWAKGSPTHVQVRWDGTPGRIRWVALYATVSFVIRASTPSEAKRVALLLMGLIDGPLPAGTVHSAVTLNGPDTARDPKTLAELASFTARVTVRSTPFTGS